MDSGCLPLCFIKKNKRIYVPHFERFFFPPGNGLEISLPSLHPKAHGVVRFAGPESTDCEAS
jgi:hypothetical protein